jgi:flagellar protein FlgJ
MDIGLSVPSPYVPATQAMPEISGDGRTMDPADARRIAQGFESIFLAQVLKEMRQTLQDGGMFPGDTGDVQGGMFDLFMSQHLAQAGGIGIASMLERHLATMKTR